MVRKMYVEKDGKLFWIRLDNTEKSEVIRYETNNNSKS